MAKTRLASLPKKERDFIADHLVPRPHLLGNLRDIVAERADIGRNSLAGLDRRPARSGYAYGSAADIVASDLFHLAAEILQWGIARRLLQENVADLRRAMTLHGRLRYLERLHRASDEGLHVGAMMVSQAVSDEQTVQAFVKTQPIAARSAHPADRIVCNLFTLAITPSPDLEVVVRRPRPKLDHHTGHVADALEALLADDEVKFSNHTSLAAKTHLRVHAADGLVRYLPTAAHALTRLAAKRWDRPATALTPEGAEFDLELLSDGAPNLDADVLACYSPRLVEAVETLPASIDLALLSPSLS